MKKINVAICGTVIVVCLALWLREPISIDVAIRSNHINLKVAPTRAGSEPPGG
jgi:hypothetical protein